MSIQHSAILDADRHEPKHASTAISSQVCMSNGDGTTSFNFVNYADLVGVPSLTAYVAKLSGFSTASSQAPSAVSTAKQLEFGSGITTTVATLDSSGGLTFNVAGSYLVRVSLNVSRGTGAGIAIVMARGLLNGAQIGPSKGMSLDNALNIIPLEMLYLVDANSADVFTVEISRDSAGINDGGVYNTSTSTSGWNSAPSAFISLSKFGG